ncbi:MAG: FmdB family zinc ribbon protein [Candidatus Methylomirabilales bacterium]
MPTYEYACTACGHRLEVVQSFADQPLEVCGRCSGRLRRVFHPAGVLFKGSGFYATDHRYRGDGAGEAKRDQREAAPGRVSAAGGEAAGATPGKQTDKATSEKSA